MSRPQWNRRIRCLASGTPLRTCSNHPICRMVSFSDSAVIMLGPTFFVCLFLVFTFQFLKISHQNLLLGDVMPFLRLSTDYFNFILTVVVLLGINTMVYIWLMSRNLIVLIASRQQFYKRDSDMCKYIFDFLKQSIILISDAHSI